MNPYLTIILDLVALMETPQFGQLVADIKAAEGGSGNAVVSPAAAKQVRDLIASQKGAPVAQNPATVPLSATPPRGRKGANSLT